MNRHKIIAIGMAPLLVMGGYFAADNFLSEKKNKPSNYQLSLKDECRPTTNSCTLTHDSLNIRITASDSGYELVSSLPLKGVILEVTTDSGNDEPIAMSSDKDNRHWRVKLDSTRANSLRLVCSTGSAIYFAEVLTNP